MALLLLVKNPEKLDRLSEELESEFGFPNGSKIPDIEKLKRLPYLNAVINESMRISPVTLGKHLKSD
jgi:cytochrome P450